MVTPAQSYVVPANAQDAIRIQEDLRHQVVLTNQFNSLDTLAGVDVSFDLTRELTKAIIVLFDARNHEIIESVRAVVPTTFPYIPGLLSFREIPALLAAFAALATRPDLLMVDGQGVAHPRRLGIAAHLGVLMDIPAIGVAKSRLYGRHTDPGQTRGGRTPLQVKGEEIGTVICSKDKCNPLYVSAGHKIDQAMAVRMTQDWLTTYRLPEPTRIADKLSKVKL